MSDVESESSRSTPAGEPTPFTEDDGGRTRLPYDDGGVPFYIAVAWVSFIVVYITVVAVLVVPDLRAWFSQ